MENNLKPEKPLDLDDVLVNELGQFGRFQLNNILLVALPLMISAWLNEYVFSAAAIPHRCWIPECDSVTNTVYKPKWVYNAIPEIGLELSSCWRYQVSENFNAFLEYCPANAFNRSTFTTCENYVYAHKNSVVYDFDLICQEWLRALAGTFNSIGTLLVMPISGFISDRYGRKIALVISLFKFSLFGVVKAFSINYPMFLILQLLQTTFGAGIFSTAYIFATELVGPKYRMAVSATCSSMFALGLVSLGAIAWLAPGWRILDLILFIPSFLLISYYWILTESVRWLLSKNKYQEARNVLEKVASVNGKKISDNSLRSLTVNPILGFPEEVTKRSLISTVFNSPVLFRRVCTTPVWWMSTTLIYYGLSINSTSLSDTTYLNYMLTGAIELPGFWTAFFFVNRLGRKPTLSGGYFLCAVCNIAFAFIDPNKETLRLILYLLGKYGIACVFTSLYLFTSELYPTEYRHTLLAFSSMIGRIGSIVAPLTPVLKQYWAGIPSILFGFLGLISGLLILTQPETLGTKLPDTLEEAEALGIFQPEPKIKKVSAL